MRTSMPWHEGPACWKRHAYIAIGVDKDLNVAMHSAIVPAIDIIKDTQGMDFRDALSICSVAADFEVTQVVDGTKGIHAMIPKAIFKKSKAESYTNHLFLLCRNSASEFFTERNEGNEDLREKT